MISRSRERLAARRDAHQLGPRVARVGGALDVPRPLDLVHEELGGLLGDLRRLGQGGQPGADADVRVGEGPVVEGPLAALLLLVTGRTSAEVLALLDGPGVAALPR